MLDKLFLGGVLVLVVSVIAGESYRHGVVVGARQGVRAAEIAPTRPRIDISAARSRRSAVRTSEISALERRYMLEAVQDARRARRAAERAERLMQQELRTARWEQERLVREQTRLVREQRQTLRRRPRLSPVRTTPIGYGTTSHDSEVWPS